MEDHSARPIRSTRSAGRPALADVSNLIGKRKFVSVSSGAAAGSENQNDEGGKGTGKPVLNLGKDYLGVENLGKGKKIVFEFGGKGDGPVLKAKEIVASSPDTRLKPQQETSRFGNSKINTSSRIVGGIKVNSPMTDARGDGGKKIMLVGGGGGGGGGKSLLSGLKPNVPAPAPAPVPPPVKNDNAGIECAESGNVVTNICQVDGEGSEDAGEQTSSKPSLVGGSMPSVGSNERESEKCAFSDFGGTSNNTAGMDILKSCSCSFCRKAAYIWSDLQYQDTKGRIAALKRSRKDVRSVIDKSCSYGGFGKSVLGSSNKPTKLEHDLMGQWRSLFLHTEDVLIRESSQLQSSILSLKNLRGSCKSDLEKTSATSSFS